MEMRETDELAQPVVPVEAPEPVAAESVEATVTSEAPAPAEAEEVTSEKVAAPATKDELMALMETLVAAPLEEAGKADAAHLKQMFYNFRKAELDAELADFLANGGELNAFVPAVNADEERFKEMLATLRERRAELTAAQRIAEGEAEYMRILAAAYDTQEKKDFYEYILALEALKASLSGDNKTVVLYEDSELAKILMGLTG